MAAGFLPFKYLIEIWDSRAVRVRARAPMITRLRSFFFSFLASKGDELDTRAAGKKIRRFDAPREYRINTSNITGELHRRARARAPSVLGDTPARGMRAVEGRNPRSREGG